MSFRQGARQFFEKRGAPAGPTARDYVQNGLVAMWDGIENAGWGVHDAAATVWKDLVGGQELEFSGTTANADSVGFVTGAYVYSNGNIGLTTANTLQGEICIDLSSPPENRQYVQFAGSNIRIFALANRVRGGISLVHNAAGHGDWPAGKHVLSAYWPDNVLHIDSELRETVTGIDTWSIRKKSTIIGDVLMNGSLGFTGNVHCIRLYSRALTAAEIAANYAIDKTRFNLP